MATGKRDRADFFTLKARKEGYPARSVYKLEEIQKLFRVVGPGFKVLDVGAAPGSWTLYLHRRLLQGRGSIVAVDLNPLALDPIPPGVRAIVGDAFSPETGRLLDEEGLFDAVVSDAAPMTTGSRTVDAARSENLVREVLALARTRLRKGGNLVVKIFQGGAEAELLREMRGLYAKARAFKPSVCRADSFETYLIGLDKRG